MKDISISGGAKNMMAVNESDDSDDNNHNQNKQISGTKRRQPPPEFYSSELGQSMQHTSSKRPHLQPDAPQFNQIFPSSATKNGPNNMQANLISMGSDKLSQPSGMKPANSN